MCLYDPVGSWECWTNKTEQETRERYFFKGNHWSRTYHKGNQTKTQARGTIQDSAIVFIARSVHNDFAKTTVSQSIWDKICCISLSKFIFHDHCTQCSYTWTYVSSKKGDKTFSTSWIQRWLCALFHQRRRSLDIACCVR